MELTKILNMCDHTVLSPAAVWADIKAALDDGMAYGVAAVCIAPCFVKAAKQYVGERLMIGSVVGFPHGNTTTAVKCFEAADAAANGADELDMVINIGWAKEERWTDITDEIAAVKKSIDGVPLKVIIETCFLTEEEKIALCKCVSDAGADFIKTSTGFASAGAKVEDVELFRAHVAPHVKVKAAGGISTAEDAERLIEAGAQRIGASRLVKLAKQ